LALGADGEALAARWYEAQGYSVVVRNWRCPLGELDLVVRRDRTLVFCEVKTRSSLRFGTPALAVGVEKQRRLRRLAGQFLSDRRPPGITDLRFDVAAIVGTDVEVYEAAF
jgi:putative endonuclease